MRSEILTPMPLQYFIHVIEVGRRRNMYSHSAHVENISVLVQVKCPVVELAACQLLDVL